MKTTITRTGVQLTMVAFLCLHAWIRQAVSSQVGQETGLNAPALPPDVRATVLSTESGAPALDARQTSEFLVDAIIQIESSGNFLQIGRAGERGLMQIKPDTWKEVTQRLYGKALPFDWAFDPELNRKVGKAYLADIQQFLHEHREHWRSDERSLLLAAYNAGPARLQRAGFDVRETPVTTQDYVERATAMHDYYLADQAPKIRRLLTAMQSMAEDKS